MKNWRIVAALVLALVAGLAPAIVTLMQFGPKARLADFADRPEAMLFTVIPMLVLSVALAVLSGALLRAEVIDGFKRAIIDLFRIRNAKHA